MQNRYGFTLKETEMNIRAYKIILPDGRHLFEIKTNDEQKSQQCATLESLAALVNSEVEKTYSGEVEILPVKTGTWEVTVDFIPFHNMECPVGQAAKLCLPLSITEIVSFWEHYHKKRGPRLERVA